MTGMDRFAFSRFSEKRNYRSSDVSGYDEYVEGVAPEDTASLDTPIAEDNKGFRLIQKMGWKSGKGLGKHQQGRVEPVPFELKDDYLGLGRWTMELELAQDATEKRKQMEIEKEITPDLVEKYKVQAEKDQQMAETIAEMRKSFYCELCDKQYTKYSEYDNHINSHDHHHKQRLKDLKQYETGRRFGGHRNIDEQREKIVAAHMVAIERARMNIKRSQKGFSPAFKPIGQTSTNHITALPSATPILSTQVAGVKRSHEDSPKVAEKKARIAKYGLKFQSAGTLVSVADGKQEMTSGGTKTSIYRPPGLLEDEESPPPRHKPGLGVSSWQQRYAQPEEDRLQESETSGGGKLSFGFSKKKGGLLPQQPAAPKASSSGSAPPPKVRNWNSQLAHAFADASDDEEDMLAQLPVRRLPKFRFNINK